MATEVERIDKLEERYSNLHTVVNVLANKVDNIATEMQDFKNEMRQRDEQRRAEISEIRQSISAIGNHTRNLAVTAMICIGAMCITVIYSVVHSAQK